MQLESHARRILEEHEELLAEAQRLELMLQSDSDGFEAQWFAQCGRRFAQFHGLLGEHLKSEELNGFMKPVTERRPTLSTEVDRLLQDHHDILQHCKQLQQFFEQSTTPTAQDCAARREDALALLVKLRCHEQAENKLIQETFNLDIGAGD